MCTFLEKFYYSTILCESSYGYCSQKTKFNNLRTKNYLYTWKQPIHPANKVSTLPTLDMRNMLICQNNDNHLPTFYPEKFQVIWNALPILSTETTATTK
jgi:hypothetical protein